MNGDDVYEVDSHDAAREPGGKACHRIRRRVSQTPRWLWALPCTALAGLYAVVWPSFGSTSNFTSLTYLILRWGHSATWALLVVLKNVVRGSKLRFPTHCGSGNR